MAGFIRDELTIPVLGIGAGDDVDGQLLIVCDVLGEFQAFTPKFVKKYADIAGVSVAALSEYVADVRGTRFPPRSTATACSPAKARSSRSGPRSPARRTSEVSLHDGVRTRHRTTICELVGVRRRPGLRRIATDVHGDNALPTHHHLRHTHTTPALQAGVHPKVVSERLGHARASITLDTYSHAIPTMQESAAALSAGLVFAGERCAVR